MKILAIDPGSKCGYAVMLDDWPLASGVWDLSARRHEGGGMRFLRLRAYLDSITFNGELGTSSVDAVFYEEVRRHLGTDAAHIYGGIVAVISAWCEERRIPYQGIPVGTVKKTATGKGNANKEAMLASATKQWPTQFIADDNQADALWIGHCGWLSLGAPQ